MFDSLWRELVCPGVGIQWLFGLGFANGNQIQNQMAVRIPIRVWFRGPELYIVAGAYWGGRWGVRPGGGGWEEKYGLSARNENHSACTLMRAEDFRLGALCSTKHQGLTTTKSPSSRTDRS